jgi:hypothetical protein
MVTLSAGVTHHLLQLVEHFYTVGMHVRTAAAELLASAGVLVYWWLSATVQLRLALLMQAALSAAHLHAVAAVAAATSLLLAKSAFFYCD